MYKVLHQTLLTFQIINLNSKCLMISLRGFKGFKYQVVPPSLI